MKDLLSIIGAIVISILIVAVFVGCTVVRVDAPDGTRIAVTKFHPMGEELAVEGLLDGVGTLSIDKNTQDSAALADSVIQGLLRAAAPN